MDPRRLFVGGVPPLMNDEGLRRIFEPYGEIQSCTAFGAKGIGFVTFERPEDAKRAMEKVDHRPVGRGSLRVSIALARQPRKVKVSGFPAEVKEDDIREEFRVFGPIGRVLMGTLNDGRPSATVIYSDDGSAQKAEEEMNGTKWQGTERELAVHVLREGTRVRDSFPPATGSSASRAAERSSTSRDSGRPSLRNAGLRVVLPQRSSDTAGTEPTTPDSTTYQASPAARTPSAKSAAPPANASVVLPSPTATASLCSSVPASHRSPATSPRADHARMAPAASMPPVASEASRIDLTDATPGEPMGRGTTSSVFSALAAVGQLTPTSASTTTTTSSSTPSAAPPNRAHVVPRSFDAAARAPAASAHGLPRGGGGVMGAMTPPAHVPSPRVSPRAQTTGARPAASLKLPAGLLAVSALAADAHKKLQPGKGASPRKRLRPTLPIPGATESGSATGPTSTFAHAVNQLRAADGTVAARSTRGDGDGSNKTAGTKKPPSFGASLRSAREAAASKKSSHGKRTSKKSPKPKSKEAKSSKNKKEKKKKKTANRTVKKKRARGAPASGGSGRSDHGERSEGERRVTRRAARLRAEEEEDHQAAQEQIKLVVRNGAIVPESAPGPRQRARVKRTQRERQMGRLWRPVEGAWPVNQLSREATHPRLLRPGHQLVHATISLDLEIDTRELASLDRAGLKTLILRELSASVADPDVSDVFTHNGEANLIDDVALRSRLRGTHRSSIAVDVLRDWDITPRPPSTTNLIPLLTADEPRPPSEGDGVWRLRVKPETPSTAPEECVLGKRKRSEERASHITNAADERLAVPDPREGGSAGSASEGHDQHSGERAPTRRLRKRQRVDDGSDTGSTPSFADRVALRAGRLQSAPLFAITASTAATTTLATTTTTTTTTSTPRAATAANIAAAITTSPTGTSPSRTGPLGKRRSNEQREEQEDVHGSAKRVKREPTENALAPGYDPHSSASAVASSAAPPPRDDSSDDVPLDRWVAGRATASTTTPAATPVVSTTTAIPAAEIAPTAARATAQTEFPGVHVKQEAGSTRQPPSTTTAPTQSVAAFTRVKPEPTTNMACAVASGGMGSAPFASGVSSTAAARRDEERANFESRGAHGTIPTVSRAPERAAETTERDITRLRSRVKANLQRDAVHGYRDVSARQAELGDESDKDDGTPTSRRQPVQTTAPRTAPPPRMAVETVEALKARVLELRARVEDEQRLRAERQHQPPVVASLWERPTDAPNSYPSWHPLPFLDRTAEEQEEERLRLLRVLQEQRDDQRRRREARRMNARAAIANRHRRMRGQVNRSTVSAADVAAPPAQASFDGADGSHEALILELLPEEMLMLVFQNMLPFQRLCCREVCRHWARVAADLTLWSTLDLTREAHWTMPLGFVSDFKLATVARTAYLRGLSTIRIHLARFVSDGGLATLGQLPLLEDVSLKSCTAVTDKGVFCLAASLPNLRRVRFTFSAVTDASLEVLGACCPLLESLDLTGSIHIFGAGLPFVTVACPLLRALCLDECPNVGEEALSHIAAATGLTSLSIEGCLAVGDEGVARLCSGPLASLTDLGLADVGISDSSMEPLGSVFPGLLSITLRSSSITDEGLEALASRCTRLVNIDCAFCPNITNGGVYATVSLCPNLLSFGRDRE